MSGDNEASGDDKTSTAEPTMRDDVETAIAAVESTGGEVAGVPADEKKPAAASQSASEKSTPAGPAPQDGGKGEKGTEDPQAPAPGAGDYPDDGKKYPTLNKDKVVAAPESWRPKARENWKELPENVRREIHRRELDIASGLQESSGSRKISERINGFATTYGAAMAAEGVSDPLDAAEGLFRTAAQLRMGTPQEKATRLAQLITHYDIDLALLDDTLAKNLEGGAQTPAAAISPAIAEQLRPFQEFMAASQAQTRAVEAQADVQADQSVSTFRDNAEFVDDVRLEMADLLDVAAERGRAMTLQEAYDAACQLSPEIRGILSARATAEGVSGANAAVAAKEATASSMLRGTMGAEGGKATDGSIRGDLMRSIDELEGR